MKIVNPATEETLADLPEDTPDSIAAKFLRAREAQRDWAATPLERRLAAIERFGRLLESRQEHLAKLLTSEVGKPISQSTNELKGMRPRIDFFLNHAPSVLVDETVLEDPGQPLREKIAHEPLGVIANISAWNYPYYVGSNVFLPALLAGNAVLYKPSEFASLTGLAIAGLLWEAGVPKDAFIEVLGGGAIGTELLKMPLRGLFFTGSYATGKKVAEAVAGRMIKVQMELGGKDPTYVAEDADIDAASASIADGAFYNNGQSCCAVERIYVRREIYSRFVDAFVRVVQSFVLGNPLDPKTYLGPVSRRAHLDHLRKLCLDAELKGAKVIRGGQRLPEKGYFFEPHVFFNVTHSMDLMKQETFGPVIGIQNVENDDEALRLMNDTPYGLTAGVYSKDRGRAERILRRVDAGTAYWNCCDRVSPRLPWSGRGHSGLGTTLSTYGIQSFVQPKAWHLKG